MPNNPYLSLSENTKSEIDENVGEIINYALKKAIYILENNLDSFNKLATDLIHNRSVDLKYLNKLDVNCFQTEGTLNQLSLLKGEIRILPTLFFQ